MSMFEKPANEKPEHTPSRREAMAEQSSEAFERAERRFKIARLAHRTKGTWRQKRTAVVNASEAGLIPGGGKPSLSNVKRLQRRFEAGEQSVLDYFDAPRTGRHEKPLNGPFERHVAQALDEGSDKSARELHRECKEIAQARGLKAPTLYAVNKRVRRGYRLKRAAARHGSRAGEIDGLPHGRVLARAVHDVWSLDELEFPVWVRVAFRNAWVSVLCMIVLIIDHRSTAVVGWHLVDPEGRLDEDGEQLNGAAREEDVLAALLSAASLDLAPDSCVDFAGHLPLNLRWDNHKAHHSLAKKLHDFGVNVDVHFIRKRRAISNGAAENRVGTLKRWTKGIRGHVDRYIPTDQVKNEAAANQSMNRTALSGGTGDRRTERRPIRPADLMDVYELRDEFNRIVRRYNYEHVNRVFNATANDLYFRNLPPHLPRNGLDLLAVIEPEDTMVTDDGILHFANNRQYQFETIVDGSILLLDTTVVYRPDPLLRGIFVERHHKHHFVPPTPTKTERALEIARNQVAVSRRLSDVGKDARKARMWAEIGEEATAAAEEEYKEQIDLFRQAQRNGGAPPEPAVEDLTAAGPETLEPEDDPYAQDDDDPFVGAKEDGR